MPTQPELERAIRDDFRNALWEIFRRYEALTISTNWQVLDKTYGEVGGRFLEDFLISELQARINDIQQHHIVGARAPAGRRTMEDVIAEWEIPGIPRQQLLISIKGHRATSASNPNLVSLQKAKRFYENHHQNCHFLLLVVHYLPERIEQDGFHMQIQGMDIIHLKDLRENHVDLQAIGAGGQFLLRGIAQLQESYRTAREFHTLICQKEAAWQERRRTG